MKASLVLILFTLVLSPAAVAAQATPAARIDAARRGLAAAGVPTSLLDNRIAEGRAKGVSMERIAAVVERRAAALTAASRAMDGNRVGPGELSAGADAIEAGIDAGSLRSVIAASPDNDRPVAIAVLTYLHRERGLPVGQALARVKAAIRQGPEALRTLPAEAAANARRGGAPNGSNQPPAGAPPPGQRPGAGKPIGRGNGPPAGNPGAGNPGHGH